MRTLLGCHVLLLLALFTRNAEASGHQCMLSSMIQVYDSKTVHLKTTIYGKSNWFYVTTAPHEEQKPIEIQNGNIKIGAGTIWTGTLLGTPEGDLIQANSSFVIEDVEGSATLIMDVRSPMAKTVVMLNKETSDEIHFITAELKCETKQL